MLPILSDVLELVGKAVDKIIPDAEEREKIKSKLQISITQLAIEEKKLVFQDLASARELYREELREKGIWKVIKNIRALVRPLISLSVVVFYIYAKVKHLELSNFDYMLFSGVFAFYFGLRTFEKFGGKA